MSFAKAKRENKKIEARQEKRDLEDKYKALEVSYYLHKQFFYSCVWDLGMGHLLPMLLHLSVFSCFDVWPWS